MLFFVAFLITLSNPLYNTFMKCPACKETLLTLEYAQIELDYCASCLGIWLDAGELEVLLGGRELLCGFMTAGNPAQGEGEVVRLCPICETRMQKAVTGGGRPVVYDRCSRGHGLWFDQGELLSVMEQGLPHAGSASVVRWLREIFSPSPEKSTSNP